MLPSEIRDLDVEDFQFNLLVANLGVEQELKATEKAMKAGRR